MLNIFLGLLAIVPALAVPTPNPRSVHPRSGIPISDNTVAFTSKLPRSAVRQDAFGRFVSTISESTGGDQIKLSAPLGASEYALPITVGKQTFQVIFDTGSSDLWLVAHSYVCRNQTDGAVVSHSECNFGPELFNSVSNAAAFTPLDYPSNFNISYGEGTTATGTPGTGTVEIGGLSVKDAEFSIVKEAYFVGFGDGITDGLIGFANPLLTSVYYGTDPTQDTLANEAEYDPVFFQAVDDGLVQPFFSIALNRPSFAQESDENAIISSLGSLTLGGIPSSVAVTSKSVTVPNMQFTLPLDGTNVTQPLWYTLEASSFNFPGSKNLNTDAPLIILDSGTTLVYVPNKVAKAFNGEISPAAVLDSEEGIYYIDCDASIPSLSVTIDGVEFAFTRADLVFPADDGTGRCISTIVPGGTVSDESIFILGDRFLVNVVATFNVQTNEITITERKAY